MNEITVYVDGEPILVESPAMPSNVLRKAGIKRPIDYDLIWVYPENPGDGNEIMRNEMTLMEGDEFVTAKKVVG